MNKLPLHISSGGVVYKKESGKTFIALLGWFTPLDKKGPRLAAAKRKGLTGQGKWGQLWMFPKETVEEKDAKGKNFEEKQVLKTAALRGLKEEIDIEGKIEDYLGELQEKVTFNKTRKERHIHYFLIRYTQGELKNSWEHDTAKWFPADEALNLRFKKGEEEIAKKALDRINKI